MLFYTGSQRAARTAALQSVAGELELDFSERDEWGMRSLLGDFELFQKGHRRKITNILSKTSGLMEEKVNIFDYQFTISTGKSSRTYYQTVFFMQSKELELPEMLIYPENFFHKIGSLLGMQDIDFEEWKSFSDQFLLQGDEWRIRRLMNEEIARFFLVQKNWCLESLGYYLVFYRRKSLVEPHAVKSLYAKGLRLYEQLKTKP